MNEKEKSDQLLITGVEDGWIKVDKETWKEYLKLKRRGNENGRKSMWRSLWR